jgi:hypothetical protein
MFNFIYDGAALAQQGCLDLIDDIADNFFHWKDQQYVESEVAYWVDAAITTVFTFGGGSIPGLAQAIRTGIGAFASAGSQHGRESQTSIKAFGVRVAGHW